MTVDIKSAELRAAIRRGEIVVHYQPQAAAATGRIAGVECLVRWAHPQRGLLTPADFLDDVADDEEIVQLLGETVLKQACHDARAWDGLFVGLNVSPVQFRLPGFADRLVAIARAQDFQLDRLELEILETSFFENPAHMHEVLAGLRKQGVRIALDDFGTGYSSLSALLDLPLDKLKIDAGFVRKSDDIRSASIIHAIIALARAIGLKVTAEGVETARQQTFLRAAGCQFLQGYLISKAIPAGAVTDLVLTGGVVQRKA